MRKAITVTAIRQEPKVQIDGIGTMRMISFVEVLYNAGKIDYKTRMSVNKFPFTSEYATKLLNENLELFPADF